MTQNGLKFVDDVFGVNRFAAYRIVEDLLEAWTPEREHEIVSAMQARGASLVERVVIGDYDLVLWHYHKIGEYAVSLNSGQEDPTTEGGQQSRTKAQELNRQQVVTQLQKWVRAYGRILVSSSVPSRIRKYRRMLTRHFLTAAWSEYPNAGFFILPD